VLVGFLAGGRLDVFAHMLAQWMLDQRGRTFVVENRPGAASNIAAAEVVRAVGVRREPYYLNVGCFRLRY
jgi:tripartite-type tricarboxylate transporter receptor subunit TctC